MDGGRVQNTFLKRSKSMSKITEGEQTHGDSVQWFTQKEKKSLKRSVNIFAGNHFLSL